MMSQPSKPKPGGKGGKDQETVKVTYTHLSRTAELASVPGGTTHFFARDTQTPIATNTVYGRPPNPWGGDLGNFDAEETTGYHHAYSTSWGDLFDDDSSGSSDGYGFDSDEDGEESSGGYSSDFL